MLDKFEQSKLLLYYEQIFDLINEGIHVIDATGCSLLYNQKMAHLEGMSKQEVLGQNVSAIFQFPPGQESTLLQVLRTGQSIRNSRQTYFNDKGKQITTINHTYPLFAKEQIIGAVEIANDVTKMERLLRESLREPEKNGTRYTFEQIVGVSAAIRELIELAKRAARTSSSVLVVGETGTGKELFVQSIHNASARSQAPFISQNCAAIPENLVESLLFGTARGAFTGAVERPGLFEQAEGGTLFLDEINSLSLHLQTKLLRVLQEKTVRRIGDTKDRLVNVRIIAAMNEDPIEAISQNRLRKDLFYRLSVVSLFVPPLRERKEDILPLTLHFIEKYNQLFQMDVNGIEPEVEQFFHHYAWPGNVRELQHFIEGAMNLMNGESSIAMEHLPLQHTVGNAAEHRLLAPSPAVDAASAQPGASFRPLKEQMALLEQSYIEQVVSAVQGNISQAAKLLGISRQSLQYRLRKFRGVSS